MSPERMAAIEVAIDRYGKSAFDAGCFYAHPEASDEQRKDGKGELNASHKDLIALISAPEPAPEISEEQVERGAKALWDVTAPDLTPWEEAPENMRAITRNDARAVISALTGGAE